MPFYLVRAHLPATEPADVRRAADRAADAAMQLHREGFDIRHMATTYLPGERWLGCLYEADTAAAAQLAIERASIPFDDIVEAVRY